MPRWEHFHQFLAEAQSAPNDEARQQLVDALLKERPQFPWVDGSRVTFIYSGLGVERVAVNLDIIDSDPPFIPMQRLEGTSLWYVEQIFDREDLLDYVMVVDDPMTPLAKDPQLPQRIARYWRADPRNPRRLTTAQADVSVLRMPSARPFPDWESFYAVPRGQIFEHEFSSVQMQFNNRKLWVYTPPTYAQNPHQSYPLMVLLDGQWMVGALQVPAIADALIKHGRMEGVVIAMLQSGSQAQRVSDFISNDKHYAAILTELLPFLQSAYRLDATNLGIGGVDVGAIAAAHCALKNPAVFSHLIMVSPPLGKGQAQEKLLEYADRFKNARLLPRRIFQSVGRYENATRYYKPNLALGLILQEREMQRHDIDHEFIELGSGHSLVAFKSALPEALAHVFPADSAV